MPGSVPDITLQTPSDKQINSALQLSGKKGSRLQDGSPNIANKHYWEYQIVFSPFELNKESFYDSEGWIKPRRDIKQFQAWQITANAIGHQTQIWPLFSRSSLPHGGKHGIPPKRRDMNPETARSKT